MSKDPAVLWYTSDFLVGVADMDDAQVGRYARMLALQHQKGGFTYEKLVMFAGGEDEDILKKFIKYPDGLYYNKRMRDETERRKKYVDNRKKNLSGKKSKKKQRLKKPTPDQIEEYLKKLGKERPKYWAEEFFNHYEAHGWKSKGGNPVVNWKNKIRTWKIPEKKEVNEL